MGVARTRVELILCGRYAAAEVAPASIDHCELSDIADALRDDCGCGWFASPYSLAESVGMAIIDTDLPPGIELCVEERAVLVRREVDIREHGLLVFRGVSRHYLGNNIGRYTEADSLILAAELAAPSAIVVRRGIEIAMRRQRWAPQWFLRAWGEALLSPPSSASRIA